MRQRFTFVLTLLVAALVAPTASAQLPDCSGDDAAAATAEFELGNSLMAEAIDHAGRRHLDRARASAAEALTHFDRQCELGDEGALAERGAALMLMGEALRSAQSYDAYLTDHPLESLDARTRRRVEPNLQPGTVTVDVQNGPARLFVDGLDFGSLPRSSVLRLPYGEHVMEARDAAGATLDNETITVSAEGSSISRLTVPLPEPELQVVAPPPEEEPDQAPVEPPPPRMDFLPFYIASGVVAGVGLILGIGFIAAKEDRAVTFNRLCVPTGVPGCDAVLSEHDTFFALGVTGFVLAGIGIAGFIATYVLDNDQPREHVRVAFAPTWDGGALALSGSF